MKDEISISSIEACISEVASGLSVDFSPIIDQRINLCCSDIALRFAQLHRSPPDRIQAPITKALLDMGINVTWECDYLYLPIQEKTVIERSTQLTDQKEIVIPLHSKSVNKLDYLRLVANALCIPSSAFNFATYNFGNENFKGSQWADIWEKAATSQMADESKERLVKILENSPQGTILWMAPHTLPDLDFRDLVCGVIKGRNHFLRTLDAAYLTKKERVTAEISNLSSRSMLLYLGRTILGHDLDFAVPDCQERDNLLWLATSFNSRIQNKSAAFVSDEHIQRESSNLCQRLALYRRAAAQALTHGKTSHWVMYADSCIYEGVALLNYIRMKGQEGILDKKCLSGIDEVIQDIVQC